MLRRRVPGRGLRHAFGLAVLALALMSFSASAAGAAEDDAAWLFDPDAVVEIDLGLSPEEIEMLEEEPDEYQPGTFELKVGGVAQGPPLGEVGIRLKGSAGSFRPLSEKAAFKVKFDEYVDDQKFFGLEKLTLNNMVQDASMLHETLAYELFRSVGVAAPRTGYAFVRLNGEDFGLHLNVETLDAISLPRWFSSTRHLYEGPVGIDVTPGAASIFEVDEGKSSKREDLLALIAAANDPADDWSDAMDPVADLAQMTRMWAVERYIGHWDGYAGRYGDFYRPNNYYLHSVESGQFSMVPWGTDQTWVEHLGFDEPAGGILFNRCLADESCEALYVDALEGVRSSVADLDLDSHAAALAEMLAPWQALDPRLELEYSLLEVAKGVAYTQEFIATRPGELADWLAPEDPEPEQGGDSDNKSISPGQLGLVIDRKLRIGRSSAPGIFVSTPLQVPSAGRATQHVVARLNGRRRTVCKGRARSVEAGSLTVRCRLSDEAQRRLELGPLELKVTIGFAPEGGKSRSDTRWLTLPKRP